VRRSHVSSTIRVDGAVVAELASAPRGSVTGAQTASVAWSGACADCCPFEDAAVFRGEEVPVSLHPATAPVLRTLGVCALLKLAAGPGGTARHPNRKELLPQPSSERPCSDDLRSSRRGSIRLR